MPSPKQWSLWDIFLTTTLLACSLGAVLNHSRYAHYIVLVAIFIQYNRLVVLGLISPLREDGFLWRAFVRTYAALIGAIIFLPVGFCLFVAVGKLMHTRFDIFTVIYWSLPPGAVVGFLFPSVFSRFHI